MNEEQSDEPATGRNEVGGSVTGPVLQAGTVHGDVYFRGRRRLGPRWLWVTASLTVVAVIAYAVVVASQQDPPAQAAAGPDALRVNDLSTGSTVGADEVHWVTAAILEGGQVNGVRDGAVSRLMASTNGIRVSKTEVGVVLEGASDESVIVQLVTARILDTADAISGTIVAPPEAGGNIPRHTLGFNLDEPEPQARVPDGRGGLGERFSDKNYFEISRGEKYVFSLYGIVKSSHTYRWVVDMKLLIGDRHQTMTLGKDNPFMTTGPAHTYQRYYGYPAQLEDGLAPVDIRKVCATADCVANADAWARVF